MELKSWSFVHVFQTILELTQAGRVDLEDPHFLRETANVRVWEVMDELGRDPKELHRLTPSLNSIMTTARQFGLEDEGVNDLYLSAVAASRLVEASLGEVGYTWLSKRQISSQLIYALACLIQGDPHAEDAYEHQSRSSRFLMHFYGYNWYNASPGSEKRSSTTSDSSEYCSVSRLRPCSPSIPSSTWWSSFVTD